MAVDEWSRLKCTGSYHAVEKGVSLDDIVCPYTKTAVHKTRTFQVHVKEIGNNCSSMAY